MPQIRVGFWTILVRKTNFNMPFRSYLQFAVLPIPRYPSVQRARDKIKTILSIECSVKKTLRGIRLSACQCSCPVRVPETYMENGEPVRLDIAQCQRTS